VTALDWDGCLNVRDLGGLPTADGRRTRFRRLVRADNLDALSPAGREALVAYGVKRIVDLRFPEERAAAPPVEVVHVSLLGDRRTPEWEAEQNAVIDVAADATTYFVSSYGMFLDRCPDRFAAAVDAVAGAPEGAVCVHCMGGKDRTGLVSALLLRLAGVPVPAVVADYALTEAALAPAAREWIDAASDDTERRRRTLVQPSPAEAMRRVLAALEERHGSVASYLRRGGLGEEALRAVEERLVAA
jgi:protein-tyrosine phosphatase